MAEDSVHGRPQRSSRATRARPTSGQHTWQFKTRFRRDSFGWRSQPASQRVREAVKEIKSVVRKDAILAASGAVDLIERLSPALTHVDSSSGAIGTAVNHALRELVPVIASAPADAPTRGEWLERLWQAHATDEIPYIEALAEHWGDLCGSKEVAAAWAERLLAVTRMTLSQTGPRAHFHGTPACLSALFCAERYQDLLDLLAAETFWPYRQWAVRALVAMGKHADAIRLAEASRGGGSDVAVDRVCEEILLACGRIDEAYDRYALTANRAATYVATFRAVVRKYPHKSAAQVLDDLVQTTPGDEGKWFAAAKDAGLYAEALALARRTPCDPKTLARAARDFAGTEPIFALEAGMLALRELAQGGGYEITSADVWAAYSSTMHAADALGARDKTKARIGKLVAEAPPGGFVAAILGRQLDRKEQMP